MFALIIGFIVLLIWACQTEMRIMDLEERLKEVRDLAVEIGTTVVSMGGRLDDDGR